jgi:HPt (histidine-containing phosphotransfer) domain-containing protein
VAADKESLRQAFADEVAARLPRLEELREHHDAEDLASNTAALRDVHTLASSAVIVGEAEIAGLARAVEDDPVDGPVDALVDALQEWSTEEPG